MAFSERSSKLLSVLYTRHWIILNRFSRVSQSCTLPGALIHEMQFICLPNIKFLMLLIDLFIWHFPSLMWVSPFTKAVKSHYFANPSIPLPVRNTWTLNSQLLFEVTGKEGLDVRENWQSEVWGAVTSFLMEEWKKYNKKQTLIAVFVSSFCIHVCFVIKAVIWGLYAFEDTQFQANTGFLQTRKKFNRIWMYIYMVSQKLLPSWVVCHDCMCHHFIFCLMKKWLSLAATQELCP